MQNLQNQLKSIAKSLTALSKQVDSLSKQAAKPKPAKKTAVARKPTVKRARQAGGKTVLDTVLSVIRRSKKGVTVAQLKQKTELNSRQLSNALYKLSKKDLVYAKSRGLYVKK